MTIFKNKLITLLLFIILLALTAACTSQPLDPARIPPPSVIASAPVVPGQTTQVVGQPEQATVSDEIALPTANPDDLPLHLDPGSPPTTVCVAFVDGGTTPLIYAGAGTQFNAIGRLGNWAEVLKTEGSWHMIWLGPQSNGWVLDADVNLTPLCTAERLEMAPGATTVAVAAEVDPLTNDSYVFRALEGQAAHIRLDSTAGRVAFSLSGLSDGQPYKRFEQEDMVWQGTLGATQDYLLHVTTANETPVAYRLEIEILPLGSAPQTPPETPPVTPPQTPPVAAVNFIVDGSSQLLLGGVLNGQWTAASEMLAAATSSFNLYQDGALLERAETAGFSTSPLCERNTFVNLTTTADLTDVVAQTAAWDATPRVPERLPLDSAVYQAALAEVLAEQGLPVAPEEVILTEVMKVDLEGDGVDEVLLSATKSSSPTLPPVAAGDYSLVVLRQVVNGALQTTILQIETYPKAVELAYPFTYRVVGTYDLNGDGRLEVVTAGSRYEGFSATVFEVQPDGQISQVLSGNCP